jgi:hypothetical protein
MGSSMPDYREHERSTGRNKQKLTDKGILIHSLFAWPRLQNPQNQINVFDMAKTILRELRPA